jgi:hypothetical protein
LASAPRNVEQVLWITVGNIYFEVERNKTLLLTPLLSAELAIYDGCTDEVTYQLGWVYRGDQRGYFPLAQDEGKLLRNDLEEAIDRLSARIVDDLYGGSREARYRTAPQAHGTVWRILPPS